MIKKSVGVNETEKTLADFCERSFLKMWTYANPYKDDGHELCDVIAAFDNHVFVFFVREAVLPDSSDKDPQVLWDRWKRNVVDRQVKTAHGAERYLRQGRAVYLDAKRAVPFPIAFDPNTAVVHKIVVAHGAKEACEKASSDNVYGSLAITYCSPDPTDAENGRPFHVFVDKGDPIHILDSHNLSIVLGELDTIQDLVDYLMEKVRVVEKLNVLSYCGEEDLLAHYFRNFDDISQRHVIGPKDDDTFNCVMIGEGEWKDFIASDVYRDTRAANESSYGWDQLIQKTCQNSFDGTLKGNSDIASGKSAIYEMVKEPRFVRRAFCQQMMHAVMAFPDNSDQFVRHVSYMPSFYASRAYIFLQLWAPDAFREREDYLDARRRLLEIACGVAMSKFDGLDTVIGIAMDAPKLAGPINSEDFILLSGKDWSAEMIAYYEDLNKELQFFMTDQMRRYERRVSEFVQRDPA